MVRLNRLFYYAQNATDVHSNGIEIIELIEKEYRKSFEEELDLTLDKEILDCSLLLYQRGIQINFYGILILKKFFQKRKNLNWLLIY